ncbi:hypothetical protein OUZ56_029311 [Daphnia magna]|uniref:G-protein coupled receptors family 1 profile domain-containing protein n=1 Tax=Daphnia magna TaxID=35525 RepID=A0ABR0B6G2_9CRUS|nr:hypothetical protein OUZ56_029311 [Daphnia magna]
MNHSAEMTATALAQRTTFDPWSLPDTFTVFAFAPEDIRGFLHPHWHTQKSPHPMLYYFFGLYYLLMGSIAISGNIIALRIFGRNPALRTPANMLVMNLAMSDLLLMITLIPECVYNFFLGGPWQFGELGCQIHSFCGALFGYNQIMTLTIISWDRYNVIVKGFNGKPLTFSKSIILIIFSWIWALGWSIAPLLGWGLYAMDGMLGTCSFDAVTTTMNNKSYLMAAFVSNYVLTVSSIIVCYYFIVQTVFHHEDELRQQAKKMNVTSLRSNTDQQAVSAEIRIAKIAIMNVTLWLVSWTPFAVICLLGTWGDTSKITPLVSELPIILSKTSCAYNPIIYALSHPKYRECLKELYPWICIVPDSKGGKRGGETQSISSSKTQASEST